MRILVFRGNSTRKAERVVSIYSHDGSEQTWEPQVRSKIFLNYGSICEIQ
jgi:hypothetical protein